eukprot:4260320-Lingulodinium_polyedra.AAC.1
MANLPSCCPALRVLHLPRCGDGRGRPATGSRTHPKNDPGAESNTEQPPARLGVDMMEQEPAA